MQAGDRVRYSGDYLNSIAEHTTLAWWAGTVEEIVGDRIAVRWDEVPHLIALVPPGRLEAAKR
jgi:hypothetical protein